MIDTVMVLAAGRGERMRPLSDALPKPALPLLREPVIASPLRLAAAAGPRRVVVNTWHLAEEMEAALDGIVLPAELSVSRENELMGTAGGIALARDRLLLGDSGSVLIINGDVVLNLDIDPLWRRVLDGHDDVILALLPHLDPQRWSRVVLDRSGGVDRIEPPGVPGAGEVPLLYPGVMVISRTALNEIPSGPGEVPDRLWRPARERGRLGGVVVSGQWREVGTPSDYLETVLAQLDGRSFVHPTAVVHSTASVATAMVGRHARVEAGAVVDAAVVTDGAVVGREARVVRSVLVGAVDAGPGEVVVDAFRAGRR